MTSVAELKRRAITDAQKEFRRQEILDGARSYFEDVGYEGFAMSQLASRLGIVKGTLYLYFPTRGDYPPCTGARWKPGARP